MSFGRGAAAGIITTSLAACALFTDTSGFTSGSPANDAGGVVDGVALDAAAHDASASADADADTSTPTSFRDDFARPDLADVGNGWTEKNPDAFRIAGGALAKSKTTKNYRDNLVYRPASEDRAEIEVSAVFTVDETSAFPEVFARAQRATITTPDGYDAYIFFVADPTSARIARQRGTADEVLLMSIELSSAVTNGMRVKLTLRVSGQALLEGIVERIDATGPTPLGAGAIADGDPDRIEGAGASGFSASFDTLGVDDFAWRALVAQ